MAGGRSIYSSSMILCFLFFLILCESTAQAQENEASGAFIHVCVLTESVDEELKTEVLDAVSQVLESGGLRVISADNDAACEDPAGPAESALEDNAAFALVCRWRSEKSGISVGLSLVKAGDSSILTESESFCPICIRAEALWLLRTMTARVMHHAGAQHFAELKILTPDVPAYVRVDDHDVGLAPVNLAIAPGKHAISASTEHVTEEHEVELTPHAVNELSLGVTAGHEDSGLTTYQGWALFSGGLAVAGIAGGALFMAYDGVCILDEDPCTTDVSHLWPMGAAAFTLAGAGLITAIVLWFIDPEAEGPGEE